MRVLFTSLRITSHFLPLVPFVEACQRRGHDVAVAAPSELAERVEKTGAAFLPLDHPGDAGLGPLWARIRQAPEAEAMRIVIAEIFAGACAKVALPGLLASMERWRPAIVVRESQEYAAVVAAEKLGIPHARVAITARNAEAQILSLAAPAVDALGMGLGLSPDPAGDRIQHEATISMFPASFELPDGSRVLRFRAPGKSPGPLPDWWGAQAGPFVYATLGTVAGSMENRRSPYRVLLDALSGLPIRVLLTIGADLPLDALGEVPPNVRVERFVSQDDVLPHASAVVCHGGSGTVLGTLAAGVPMVVAPMFADQPFNAERVAAVGAGLAVSRPASAPEIREALSRVLDEGSFKAAARRMAEEMAALPLVDEAGLELEKLARPAVAS